MKFKYRLMLWKIGKAFKWLAQSDYDIKMRHFCAKHKLSSLQIELMEPLTASSVDILPFRFVNSEGKIEWRWMVSSFHDTVYSPALDEDIPADWGGATLKELFGEGKNENQNIL